MEHKYIYTILKAQQIIAYYRYVDDILILYNKKKTDIEKNVMISTIYNHLYNLLSRRKNMGTLIIWTPQYTTRTNN
jgi:hypothetical protein